MEVQRGRDAKVQMCRCGCTDVQTMCRCAVLRCRYGVAEVQPVAEVQRCSR